MFLQAVAVVEKNINKNMVVACRNNIVGNTVEYGIRFL